MTMRTPEVRTPDFIDFEPIKNEIDHIREMCEQVIELEKEIDTMEAALVAKRSLRDKLKQREIPEAIQSQGLVDVNFSDLGKVSVKEDCYVSILAQDRDAWYAWLRANDLGGVITQQESIHHLKQKALVKEQLSLGRELPDFVKITPYKTITIRR